jgi:phosphoglycerate dehydrogenase-like enzyme
VLLALRRKLSIAVIRQAAHQWAQNDMYKSAPFKLLRGSRMGLVGAGAIGSAVARLAAAVGMHVVALRRHPFKGRPEGVETVLPPSELGRVLADSDVIVLAAPVTEETRRLIGSSELRQMKPDAILVNVARGKLVNEAELTDELRRGTIGGAALDVFEQEPLDPESPLWDLPNVLITPHTAGFRQENWDLTTDLFCENLERFRGGRPLLCEVDKQAGY